jgi:hypothetical protein
MRAIKILLPVLFATIVSIKSVAQSNTALDFIAPGIFAGSAPLRLFDQINTANSF